MMKYPTLNFFSSENLKSTALGKIVELKIRDVNILFIFFE